VADPGSSSRLSFDSYGASARGPRRATNQDQFLVGELGRSLLVHQTSLSREDHSRVLGRPQGLLMVVADGLSGNPAGEVASSVAVDTLVEYVVDVAPWLFGLDSRHEDDLQQELSRAVARCAERVGQASRALPDDAEMGTTLTLAYVVGRRMYVVHLGDSRGYLLRHERLYRVTRDHTVAARLEQQGVLTREQAEESRFRNVLWNAVGGAERSVPDVYRVDLRPGDTVLLCSDGLTDALAESDVAATLSLDAPAEETARALVAQAGAASARDDVTVVVARVS